MPSSDINGDGRDDVLWRRDDGTFTAISGNAYANPDLNFENWVWVPLTWKLVATGDFNGDGRDDVFWRNDDGRMSNWLGLENGGLFDNSSNALTYVPIEWRVAGAGDFNGDGRDDILWRHDDGRLSDWLGLPNGGFADNASNGLTDVPTAWSVEGIGDFNGDGRDDILWRHEDGRLSNWLGLPNGGFQDNAANGLTLVPIEWQVEGVGDFNGDGRDDILWRHIEGRFSNWLGLPNGGFADNVSAEIFSYDGQFGRDTAYFDGRVDAIGDFNGDGRDDVLVVTRSGDPNNATPWLGQSNGLFFYGWYTAVLGDWTVQPPRSDQGPLDY